MAQDILKSLSLGQKKVVLFPKTGRVKLFWSLTCPNSQLCIRVYIFIFKNYQTNKQKKQETKKSKNTKEEKRIPPESQFKKQICRPDEDFSCHSHFWKQDFFFLPYHFCPLLRPERNNKRHFGITWILHKLIHIFKKKCLLLNWLCRLLSNNGFPNTNNGLIFQRRSGAVVRRCS